MFFWGKALTEISMKLFRNCVGTVSELFRNCFGMVSELFRNCFGMVSELFRNCFGIVFGAVSELFRNGLRSHVGRSRVARKKLVQKRAVVLSCVALRLKMFSDVPNTSGLRAWATFVNEKNVGHFCERFWGPASDPRPWVTLWVTLGKHSVGHFWVHVCMCVGVGGSLLRLRWCCFLSGW